MAKKKTHDEQIRRGIAELERLGVRLDESPSALVRRLKEVFGKQRDVDLAIVFSLGRIVDRAAMEFLNALEQEAADKEIKREIRRAVFKLAQRGIAPPRAEEGERVVRGAIFAGAPAIEGYLSAVDGAGGRLVWLAKPQTGSGLQVLQGMVSDREGLQRVGGAMMRRKELRHMIQEIKDRHQITMISVPWEYGDRILCEGYEEAKARGGSGVENFSSLRGALISSKTVSTTHPIHARISVEEARGGDWRENSRRLLEEPEFRPWLLDEDWMRPYLEQLKGAQESRLVLNPLQKEERLAGIVREAVQTLFAGKAGSIYQRRMEDMALYLCETKRRDLAKSALAVALQLKEGELGPLDISFLTGLVQKSFAYYASQENAKSEQEPSFIVKP